MPPIPEFARGDWNEISPVISFNGQAVVAGPNGPEKFTREAFIRGAASILYGDRADAIVEHWRKLNVAEPKPEPEP